MGKWMERAQALTAEEGNADQSIERANEHTSKPGADEAIFVDAAADETEQTSKPQPFVAIRLGQHWIIQSPDRWLGSKPGTVLEITGMNGDIVGIRCLTPGSPLGVTPMAELRRRCVLRREEP
jgi:hypothetical protein